GRSPPHSQPVPAGGAGTGIGFADQETAELTGVPGEWRLQAANSTGVANLWRAESRRMLSDARAVTCAHVSPFGSTGTTTTGDALSLLLYAHRFLSSFTTSATSPMISITRAVS